MQRCAQLVAHHGEKLILGAQRSPQFLVGFAQFSGTHSHALRQGIMFGRQRPQCLLAFCVVDQIGQHLRAVRQIHHPRRDNEWKLGLVATATGGLI